LLVLPDRIEFSISQNFLVKSMAYERLCDGGIGPIVGITSRNKLLIVAFRFSREELHDGLWCNW
jgi:hypothetical protein